MATGGPHSAKPTGEGGSGGLEPPSPAERTVPVGASDGTATDHRGNHGNPVTEQNTSIDIPRKPSSDSPHLLPATPTPPASNGSSHAPPESGPSAEEVLRDAGVELDLSKLQLAEGGGAPLELLSQFIASVMDDEFEAAKLLCEKILEFEPENSTALEFLPVILERLQLDSQLPSESSSSDSSSSSSSSGSSSSSSDSEEEDKGAKQGRTAMAVLRSWRSRPQDTLSPPLSTLTSILLPPLPTELGKIMEDSSSGEDS